MKIVADCDIPFLKGVLEPYAEVAYIKGVDIAPSDVVDADALIVRTRTMCNAALLDGSTVKLVATATIGFDHIDTAYCASRGIEVFTSKGCNSRGVLQWVSCALSKVVGDPAQMTLGVVGVGNIGSIVSEYARMWGFRVLCCDPPAERRGETGFVSLDKVARESDIITFHVPLNNGGQDNTYHIVDKEFLSKVKPEVTIFDSSRGEVFDTAAVNAAGVRTVVDTWEHEPNLDPTLLRSCLYATPHIAGYSIQGKAVAVSMCVGKIAEMFSLPLLGWYPEGVEPKTVPKKISWEQMCATMPAHFDIDSESALLKSRPEEFEKMRNTYKYRKEYF